MTYKRGIWTGCVLVVAGIWANAVLRASSSSPLPPTAMGVPKPTEITSTVTAISTTSSQDTPLRSPFEPAQTDPFVIPSPAPIKPAATVNAQPAPPPPPPQAPPLSLRIVGKVIGENSSSLVYAVDGIRFVALTTATVLSSGHRVVEVTDTTIQLSHPLLSQPVTVAIPPSPKQEIR